MDAQLSFERFDHNRKGYLDKEEFVCALHACFGVDFAKDDVQILFDEAKSNMSPPETRDLHLYTFKNEEKGGVNLPSFQDIVTKRSAVLSNFDESFRLFSSISLEKRGFITKDDLKKLFVETGQPINLVDDLFSVLDNDKDGRVSFTDFKRFTSTSYEELMTICGRKPAPLREQEQKAQPKTTVEFMPSRPQPRQGRYLSQDQNM